MDYSKREPTDLARINEFLNKHSRSWSKERWIRIKEDLRDSVWVEGALLAHPDQERVYFAPEPTQFGLIFEIRRIDITEALPTGQVKSKLGDDYDIVRIYIRKDAVLIRTEWCLASALPKVMRGLREEAKEAELSSADGALTSKPESPNGKGGGGGASPSPEPKSGGGSGGAGVSGVRG